MYGKDIRTFWCVVQGSPVPFKISAHPDADVNDLKRDIIRQEIALRDIAYSRLVLRKLNVPEPVEPAHTLVKCIRKRGDVEMFTEEVTVSVQKISTLFPQSQLPLENHVHILVDLPSSEPIAVMLLDHWHYCIP
ncbi:hypothetical protein APHAL10511_003096 [Amanita phalloides]|nr:hypothetical protein APHAL10511_003096 [Amanita phalloides]